MVAGLDFNDAAPQMDFSPLPDGTLVWLVGKLIPGKHGDDGSLTAGKDDVYYLNWEFSVAKGPHINRKIFQVAVVSGGKVNESGQSIAGNITRSMILAMLNSALGLDPKDTSPEAMNKRRIPGYAVLNGIQFAAELGIVPPQSGYPAKNKIKRVVEPGHEHYAALHNGTYVPSDHFAQAAPAWGGGQQQTPAWGGGQTQPSFAAPNPQDLPWGGGQTSFAPQQQQQAAAGPAAGGWNGGGNPPAQAGQPAAGQGQGNIVPEWAGPRTS